jgi:glycosyltransferase involved in cell wall biosynthesis
VRRLPDWVDYRHQPPLTELVTDVYNASAIFLCTSEVEGFGLPSVEAMACGAALVTTDNGGSRDYAFPGRTALVTPPRDVDGLVDAVVTLVHDDDLRVALATAGRAHVAEFTWEHSAEKLERFLDAYRADPGAYGRS